MGAINIKVSCVICGKDRSVRLRGFGFKLWVLGLLGLAGACGSQLAYAQAANPPQQNRLDQQTQQEQERQVQERIKKSQQAERVSGAQTGLSHTDWRDMSLASESPCFVLKEMTLGGDHSDKFRFARRYLNRYRGRCVGEAGLKQIVARTTDRIISAGYVTTQVKLKAQNLRSGRLDVTLLAGTLEGFKFAQGSEKINWHSAFGIRPGDVLNVRDLEQGLEQIKAVGSQDVHMNIEPGDQPGTSYVVLDVKKIKRWRISSSANNNGIEGTGKEQASTNFQWDELLHLNDVLSVTYGHSVDDIENDNFGSSNMAFDERMAWGWWTLDLLVSDYRFHEQLLGGTQLFKSSGTSQNYGIHLSRVIHRTATERMTIGVNLDARQAYNYIDNTIIAVQTRHTRSLTATVAERKYLGKAQLDASVSYQHGVPWFNGQWDPSTHDALIPRFDYQKWQTDVGYQTPFRFDEQNFSFNSSVHGQYSPDRLYGENYIGIGGPYSVRGFNGDQTLAADDGYYLRNQFGWRVPELPKIGAWIRPSFYIGLDQGGVWGSDFSYAGGHVLAGYSVGTNGALGKHFQWDVSASRKLVQPDWFGRARTVTQGSISFNL